MKPTIWTPAGMGKLFSRLTLKTFIGKGDWANRCPRRTGDLVRWLGLMFMGANAALLGVQSAQAANTLYDVQFNLYSQYQQTGAAITGQAGDYWNRLAAASGTSALTNTAGNMNGASFTWSGSGLLENGTANPSFGSGDVNLMGSYIYSSSSGSQNITFSNLTANAPFTLYIYTQGDSATTGRKLSVTFNGSTYTTAAAVAGATAFVSGQNYLTISGTTTASGTLPFSYTYAAGEADINGLQLSVANIAPAIAAQPAGQTLAAGGAVNLNVTPAGTAPFFYQWFKNGRMVLGATNSALTYSNAGVTNSGVYYVVITNAYGLGISQPAAVTVGAPQLLAWGENTSGQLGDGTTISRSLPESVATNAVTAAAGETHSLYVKSDGTLWAMGGNAYGQLGDGTLTTRSNAVSVAVNVVSVTAGRYHSLYLKNDGTLWAMGFNGYGQLGDGTQTNRSNAVSVASNVVAVAAGYYHSLYLKNDGTLWAMGANNDGQLGDGATTSRSTAELVASNVVAVASGGLHSLYLKNDGTLWGMGYNGDGELGDGTLINRSNAVAVASNVMAAAGGYGHSLYVKNDGTLWAMGYNGYGELGDGTTISRSNAVSVASNVVTVTGEFSDSMYLKNDGTLWGMGDNELGELGDGTTTQRTSPVSVSGMSLANIISGEDSIWTFGVGVPLPPTIISQPTNRTVTAGGTVTFTVTASGFAPLACQWQFNGTNINGATATNYTIASVIATNAGNYTVVVNNPGGSVTSSVAVLTINKSTPTVTAWPTATAIIYGQTLTASTLNGGSASVPGNFAFTAPSTAPTTTALQGVTFTPTDTTDYNAVTNSVSVTVNKATPVVTTWPTAMAIIYGQTLAASTLNGGLASVPGNFAFTAPSTAPTTTALQGVTFTPTDTTDYNAVTNSVSVTVNKATLSVTTWPTATAIIYGQTLASSTLSGGLASVDGSFAFTTLTTAPGAGTALQGVTFTPTDTTDYNAVSGFASVTVDKATATVVFHPTPLLATCDGTAKSVTTTTVPGGLTVNITYNGANTPPTNAGIYTVVGIISDANYAGGATNQLSIAMTGPAVAWGMGTSGQLGNGGSTNSPLPVAILNSGVLAGKTIVGVAGGSAHSYALTSEGLVYAWGNNSYGELGNNGTASSPVPVMVYTNGALSGKKITAIASGENHALALSADGLLFTWGWNNNLQLGNGSTVSYTNVPVAVDMTGVLAGKTVVALGTGNMHNQVVTSDGQIFTWGYGQFGQLGNGATTNSGVPVAVDMNGVLSGKTVIAASGGWEHTVALTSDGLVYTWGAGENYQLGDGATTNSSVPVAVATDGVLSGKTIVAIAAGEYHCLAVSSEGQVYSWGPNSNGELGNGTSTPSSVPVAVSTDGALSGKTVVSVRGTYDSSVALTDDGQVFSWGYNGNEELGNPAYANYSYVPVPVDESGALAGLVVSAISSSSQAYHVIALTIGLTAPALTSATTVTGIYGEAFTFTVAGNCVGSYSATGLPGWLAFDPATGILSGTPTMTGVFDITLVATNAFGSTSGNLAITVDKATPVVTTWPTATAITYGQTLADSTLSGGSASVDGSFAFTTPSTQPAVGTAQQVVTFTPTDTADYNTVSSMTVAGMSLHCTGSFGPTTTLNGVELGAETAFSMVATFDPTLNLAPFPSGSGVGVYAVTASITIDGYGTYQSAAGADFNIWLMNPTEMFVPFYAAGFGDQSGENGVSQIFNSTTPPFFAEAPTPTTFSDNLGPDQGNFPFAIPLGDGTSSLVVNDLGAATFTAEIIGGGTQLTGPEVTVNKITPVVTTWPTATAITYGQTLAAATLNGGSASVPGSFAFTTPATAPTITALQGILFTPTDTTNYTTVNGSVSVIVLSLPSITASPTNQTVAVSGAVDLSVSVTGDAPFSYQWFKNGGMVLGATNSVLTYSNAGVTNSGVYYVVITNAYGLGISQPAAVTVGTPQLLAWGNNDFGQLGDGTTTAAALPESVASNVVTAAAGNHHSLYVTGDGTLWAAGFNGDGELGDGTTLSRSNAVSVAGNVVAVAAGAWHSLYLKSDGTLWGMGANYNGQLGDGTGNQQTSPVSIATHVVAAAAGWYHSLYLKTDGTLWAMGSNCVGQLGDGTAIEQYLPEVVASNVVAVAAGDWHSLFLKSDGTLWTMGDNSYGQLGDGTNLNQYLPESVAGNVVAMAAGDSHSLFLKNDGTLWAMGNNSSGQLGDGTNINRYLPEAVASNVVAMTAGYYHSTYLKNDGTLWAMGNNSSGQLGDGTTTTRYFPVLVPGMSLATVVSGASANHTLAAGVPLPPVITSQPTNQTVVAGSPVTFTVTAGGVAPLSYQWQWNGTNLISATNASYALASAVLGDTGDYAVVVANNYGSTVSTTAALTVTNPLPPIMTVTVVANPTNAGSATVDGVCYVGSNVVLTVSASNNWQFVSWNDGTTNNPYAITVPATNITYTASFLQISTVTASANPTNAGSATVAGVCYVGSNVVLNASASNNWQFVSWNDGTTNNPYTITVPATNVAFTAKFAATATITVDASPSNSGLVTGGGTFLVGSTNFLTPMASNNWVFSRWSDGATDHPRAIVITTNRTYTADFVPAATVTTVAAQPAGGATTGDGPYAIGSNATVTATASTNWLFLNWNGTLTNYTATGNPHNPFSFTVTTNVTQTANFGQVTNGFVFLVLSNYTPPQVEIIGYVGPTNGQVVVPTTIDGLKVTIIGPGAFWNNGVTNIVITSNVTQVASGSITAGVIELLAVGAGIVIAADAFEDAAEIDMVEMAADVMADVMEDLADDDDVDSLKTVTVSASPEDGGICTGSGMYSEDKELLITATANTGWKFTHWDNGDTEPERTVTVVEDAEFVATFVKQVKVTAEVNEEEAGIVTGSDTYSVGDPVTLTATTTNSEWRFKNWTDEEGAAVSIENSYEFEAPEEDVTYTANFVEQVEIEAEADPTNGGFVIGGGTYDAGSPVILVATTNSGWRFNGWFLDGFITNTPTLITVASSSLEDLKYTAKFVQIVTVTGLANPTNGGTVTGGAVYDVGDTNVILTATAASGWTFVRWNDGITGNPYTNTAPATNITFTANFAALNSTNITTRLVGNQLTLAWPVDHLGWVLQSLTNNLISAGWYDLPGSGNTNWMMIQIDPANTAVFYRLRQP